MKSLMTTGLLVASLALSGNAAIAANSAPHKHVSRYASMPTHVTQRLPRDPFGADLGQFIQSMFGGGVPMRYARSQPSYRASGASESFDNSPSVDTSSNDAQAASDAQVQAQQALDNENALNASMAAAEAQNEAAQAAAIQTEINANN
jgi:hypothetical protein